MTVLVVGAGPAGLTTAVELARRGVEVDVVDLRDGGSGLSRAVGILPASLETLGPSGVADRLLAEGVHYTQVCMYRGTRLKLAVPLAPGFILGLPQDRTETHLRDVLAELGGAVRFGAKLTGLDQDGDKVSAAFEDGTRRDYAYVVGADGVRSTTRQLLGISFDGHDLPETWSIADVDADGWAHPDAFTVCQVAGGGVAVVAPLAARRYRVVSNTADALATLPLRLDVSNVRRAGTFTISIRQVARYGDGRVFLVGDAAHCHSPVGGRGMNLGIADGAELARRIVEGGLDEYSDHRHRQGKRIIAGSEGVRKAVTSNNPLMGGLVAAVFKTASVVPALRARFARQILYG